MSRSGDDGFLYCKECSVKPYKIQYHRSIIFNFEKSSSLLLLNHM